jgi:hypothetical protein
VITGVVRAREVFEVLARAMLGVDERRESLRLVFV